MMRAALWSFLLGATACSASAAEVMTPAESALATEAVERGTLIYRYDQAAWHTTDALIADVKQPDLSKVRGWVVTPAAAGLSVTYYGLESDVPKAIYSATYDGKAVSGRRLYRADEDRLLPTTSLALIAAQQRARAMLPDLARDKKLFACSKARFNEVVVPPKSSGGPISVYFLTPQTENDVLPFGGHYRFDVQDGAEPVWRAFSKGCLNISRKSQPNAVKAVVVTHLLDPQPTEIHVFEALAARTPLIVATISQNSLWGVTGQKITLERRTFDTKK